MKMVVTLILSAMLASGMSQANAAPELTIPTSASSASKHDERMDLLRTWWLWTLVAVISAGTVVTTVVVATVPRQAPVAAPTAGGAMALTVRF